MKRTYYKPNLPVQAAEPTQSQQAQNDGVAAGMASDGTALEGQDPSASELLHAVGCQPLCTYCGKPAEGSFSIHRDAQGVGPVVPLCNACGSGPYPTLLDIWARISTTPREII